MAKRVSREGEYRIKKNLKTLTPSELKALANGPIISPFEHGVKFLKKENK